MGKKKDKGKEKYMEEREEIESVIAEGSLLAYFLESGNTYSFQAFLIPSF